MIRLLLALALVGICATMNPLIAEGQEVDEGVSAVDMSDIAKSLRRCDGLPQVAMNLCAQDHAQAAASEFQGASDRVRATLDPQTRPAFDGAQTAYLAFVEASCNFDAARFEGGSAAMWLHESCMARRLATRIRSLNAFAECRGCYADTTLTDFELGELPPGVGPSVQ
jgi:uncharacterized protein YecT (DUF1311 family)